MNARDALAASLLDEIIGRAGLFGKAVKTQGGFRVFEALASFRISQIAFLLHISNEAIEELRALDNLDA